MFNWFSKQKIDLPDPQTSRADLSGHIDDSLEPIRKSVNEETFYYNGTWLEIIINTHIPGLRDLIGGDSIREIKIDFDTREIKIYKINWAEISWPINRIIKQADDNSWSGLTFTNQDSLITETCPNVINKKKFLRAFERVRI